MEHPLGIRYGKDIVFHPYFLTQAFAFFVFFFFSLSS